MTQPVSEAALRAGQENTPRINFSDGNHDLHVRVLRAWIHPVLRDLPGIDWSKTPSRVIGYLLNSVGNSPYAPHITLCIGTALGAVGASSLSDLAVNLNGLLKSLSASCETWDGQGIHLTRAVWEEYLAKTEITPQRRCYLLAYSTITQRHMTDYVERLDSALHPQIAPYLLPPLPTRLLEQHASTATLRAGEQQRRKEKSDVLVPLHTLLVALIQFRKQASQRLLLAFREACQRAEAGEALPLQFSYEETLAEINRTARTVAEVRIEKRTVVLAFTLWNRQTWTLHHPHEVCRRTCDHAKTRKANYQLEREQYFVECLGQPSDWLWFGDLVANGILMHLERMKNSVDHAKSSDEKHLCRLAYAHSVGFTKGVAVECPGVISPAGGLGRWLSLAVIRSGAPLFDPECLYRGCLFGAALATLALTNGSRASELLQVSADRFKAHPYEEQINGRSTGKEQVIWLQYLLPKGKKTEAERQLFPVSPYAYELLREIGALLKETSGRIPVVRPHPSNNKVEDLSPERYLFQWASESDGSSTTFAPEDIGVLLRLILHGLEFRTKQGEPFVVSTHLLRHVMATAARHGHEVPPEVLAFVLHHQQTSLGMPVATEYYSQMTEEQRLLALAEFMTEVEVEGTDILLSLPDQRMLDQMDEDVREVFERWHVLLETAFGFCGRIGLCPRGYDRSLCIGCPHLIPDPRKRENAVKWRKSYAGRVEELEAAGDTIDACQTRLQVQELDDLINSMDLLQQAIEDGTRRPAFLHLPSAPYDEVIIDAET